jgi:type IV pilus assembly protein PilP
MTRISNVALSAVAMLALAGCYGSEREELQQWMKDQRAQVRPNVPPISEPKKFVPQAYTEGAAFDPFNSVKLTQALRRDSSQPTMSGLIAPELTRRKEALEGYPLDAMTMVGSLARNGQPVALISVDKLLYQVKVGNYLGQNYGRITRITETELGLREIVQDAAGEWIERVATLELQERSK